LPAVILRFGSFYSYDSAHTRAIFDLTRKGFFPVIGAGTAYWNNLNVDDAALAVFKTIERYLDGIGQTFNVCDDEPATYRAIADYIAQRLGARKPMSLPPILAKLMLGAPTFNSLTTSSRCRNQLIKDQLGWQPAYPTYREGYKAEIEKWLRG